MSVVVPSVVVGTAGVVGASVGASEHAPRLLQSSWGLRLSLTSPSMMAGIWDSIKDLQIASGTIAESKSHTCSIHSTIWSSVLSLVSHWSRSVITSMQMSHSRSFGSGPWSLNRSLGKGCTKAKLEEKRREDKKRLNILLLLLLFALNTQPH